MMRSVMIAVWSSFLVAIVAEGCVFSLLDPLEILPAAQLPDHSPLAAYTIGFLVFWLFCSLASLLTCYLLRTPAAGKPRP